MKSTVTVIKQDQAGKEIWRYKGYVLVQNKRGIIIEAYFNHTDMSFHGVCFRKGDRFIEAYPTDKWFNVYEVHDRNSDALKAWYCNVTRPMNTENGTIIYKDLALDLLVYPNGRNLVLDKDEFENLNLPDKDEKEALNALHELKELFSNVTNFDIFLLLR